MGFESVKRNDPFSLAVLPNRSQATSFLKFLRRTQTRNIGKTPPDE